MNIESIKTAFSSLPLTPIEIFTYIPILILIIIISILSNKEIKKSLEQSKVVQDLLSRDRDILNRKLHESNIELEKNRQERMHELAKAAEFGRLAQGLFHDLMTPLTSIILHTEKLEDSQEMQKGLEKAQEASRRMAVYAQDIRKSLSNEGDMKLCDLGKELDSVLHLLSYRARMENVDIKVTGQPGCVWTGNLIKMRQVFSNLISNAIDSFAKLENIAHKKVTISLKKDASSYTLIIKDNGSGIPPQNLERIFDPFFTTKSRDKGTGIGLTTVKSIVETDLRGNIKVESSLGKGSTFTVVFPIECTDLASSRQPQHIPPDHV